MSEGILLMVMRILYWEKIVGFASSHFFKAIAHLYLPSITAAEKESIFINLEVVIKLRKLFLISSS